MKKFEVTVFFELNKQIKEVVEAKTKIKAYSLVLGRLPDASVDAIKSVELK